MKNQKTLWIQILVGVLALVLVVGLVSMITGDLGFENIPSGGGSSNKGESESETTTETVERSEGDSACAHTYNTGVVESESTCTTPGIRVCTCTKCGKTEENELPLSTKHTYGNLQKYTDEEHVSYCIECNTPKYASHVYVESTIAATCTANGETIYDCTCGFQKRVTIDAFGHKVTTWTPVSGDSSEHHGVCVNKGCGITISEEHSFGEKEVTKEATCSASGTKTKTCETCGYESKTVIPATGHNLSSTVLEEATCQSAGSKMVSCTNEGCDYSTTQSIPRTGHYKNEEFDSEGHVLYCVWCTTTIKITPHSFGGWTYCDDDSHERSCSCGYTDYGSHNFVVNEYGAEQCTICSFSP